MPEYLNFRCCMCPNNNKINSICPGIKGTSHPHPSECRFVKMYTDDRRWIYFVRSGIGSDQYKGFYAKNKEDYRDGIRQHGMRTLKWMDTFDEAQSVLNTYAEKKGWKEWKELNE